MLFAQSILKRWKCKTMYCYFMIKNVNEPINNNNISLYPFDTVVMMGATMSLHSRTTVSDSVRMEDPMSPLKCNPLSLDPSNFVYTFCSFEFHSHEIRLILEFHLHDFHTFQTFVIEPFTRNSFVCWLTCNGINRISPDYLRPVPDTT